jgi:dTDP-4-dehydrorhamnose reductase
MKILLLGANGQVGWELQRSLTPLGQLIVAGRDEVDLDNLELLGDYIRHHQPQIIVNAAAYTAVDKAESEPELAYKINADAVAVMATEAKKLDALLVHYSTDYVFDGTDPMPHKETDETNPLNVYGLSKLKGEQAILKSGCKHLIFRTSWVYAARGKNFVKTILRLAADKDELEIVADQIGSPTSAELIADATALALKKIIQSSTSNDYSGIYNLTAGGATTWHNYACSIVTMAKEAGFELKTAVSGIHAIEAAEFPLPAKRPQHSKLDTTKFCKTFETPLPHWDVQVKKVVNEILNEKSS